MEVESEKCLLMVVNLCMDSWMYVQEVDYDKLPFKRKQCHEYGNFTKSYPKCQDRLEGESNEQWK